MLVVVVTGILVSETSAQFECKGNLTKIVAECRKYVMKGGPKIPPSKACCDALKGADLLCLCKYVPPGIGNIISFEKALYVGRTCGLKIPPGTKCGSKNLISLIYMYHIYFNYPHIILFLLYVSLHMLNVVF